MKVVKHKARLPTSCHDNILLHFAQGKLKNLWRNQIAAQITEFLVALNSQTKQADMLKMRLKKAQLTLNIMSCILTIDPDVTVSNKMLNNHAYNVARKAHDYLFKFYPLTESEEWNIPIISSNVRDFIYQQAPELQKKDKELIIRKAAALSVHGILQLLNYDASNTVTWQQICDFNRRQARGRTLKWFDTLLGLVQQSPQLKDLCKISVESSNSESESGMDRGISINIQAIKMTKKVPSIDGRKKEFVYTQQDHTLVIGQIDKKGRSGRYTMQHWAINADNQKDDNGVIIIQRCSGCASNDKRVNKGGHGCYFNRNRPDLACINRISSCQNTPNTKSIKDILEIRNHLERQYIPERIPGFIQIYDYDTALIQNTLSNKEAVIQHIALLHHLRSIFNSSDMINIYTDGSLTTRFNANLNTFTKHMGTELGAILSAILVLQTRQRVNIFTDSQAAIDSINHTRINLTNGKNRIRVWCKSNNHSIVSSIINLVDSKHLELKLTKVKGHSGVKGNEEADRVAKNDTERLTCITINDSQQMDLKYDVYWNGKRVDRHIRKFIDNICESTLEAAWSFNRAHRTTFQDTTCVIEEKVTWALFKKNTGLNCTTSTINDRFIKHLKLTNNLLPTLEIMKERRYDLYGDVKCRMCLEENEDDDHIIYCQQLRDKWLVVANNTRYKCDQMLKDLLSQEKYLQLNQEDTQQLLLWNRKFFVHTTDSNQELPIPHAQLMIKNFFPKEKYREIKLIVKSEKATLTITTLLLEIFVNEFYRIIWQPRCNLITEWERIKGIKKQDLRKKIPAHQRIIYERTPTQQIDGATYDLKGRKILKHSE
ncbi:ribonuclease H-like domain-containing protein [Rhizophagus irregularis DAOM 181602=DAOM 197198]|nr:ribonuclease H-like domain-containing protein [Rhizophagus irregularis DAOM 181602=DAOM 197198]